MLKRWGNSGNRRKGTSMHNYQSWEKGTQRQAKGSSKVAFK